MSMLFYKDYAITSGAIRDEETGRYAPTVHITWRRPDGKRAMHSFTLGERCLTFNDATTVAEQQAKIWADRWLTQSESVPNRKLALKTINNSAAERN